MHFSFAVVLYDMEMQSASTPINFLRPRSFSKLGKMLLIQSLSKHYQRTFSLKPLDKYQLNFTRSHQAKGESKFVYLDQII